MTTIVVLLIAAVGVYWVWTRHPEWIGMAAKKVADEADKAGDPPAAA